MPHSHRSGSVSSHTRRQAPQYYDDSYTRPFSRHSDHHRHHQHTRGRYDDDIDPNYREKTYRRDHSSHSHRPSSYHPHHPTDMYASTKVEHPRPMSPLDSYRRSYSHSHDLPVARRYDDYDSDSSGSDPLSRRRTTRSNRHSTFPPTAYYAPAPQYHAQPYKQPYVHPAMPPQSPVVGSVRYSDHYPQPMHRHRETERPQYTYQPPTAADWRDDRPRRSSRAESWDYHGSSRTHEHRHRPDRKESASVPPGRPRRPVSEEGKPAKPALEKAKKLLKSKTANNTAELALAGALALAKAL
jgi:hypothetical protein